MGETDDRRKRKGTFDDVDDKEFEFEEDQGKQKKCRLVEESSETTQTTASGCTEGGGGAEDMEMENRSTVTSVGEDDRPGCSRRVRQQQYHGEFNLSLESIEDSGEQMETEENFEDEEDTRYILSSGRPRFEDSSIAKAPTIDDEFEQYFTQLML